MAPLYVSAALCQSVLPACGNHGALQRGQSYYEDNQYERALSVWRDLERREASLSRTEFARYAYLRGMTDYRLGFRSDARHWLGLAKITDQQHPGGLEPHWSSRLESALDDLNREVFGLQPGSTDAVQSIEVPASGAPTPAHGPAPATPKALFSPSAVPPPAPSALPRSVPPPVPDPAIPLPSSD